MWGSSKVGATFCRCLGENGVVALVVVPLSGFQCLCLKMPMPVSNQVISLDLDTSAFT